VTTEACRYGFYSVRTSALNPPGPIAATSLPRQTAGHADHAKGGKRARAKTSSTTVAIIAGAKTGGRKTAAGSSVSRAARELKPTAVELAMRSSLAWRRAAGRRLG